MMEKVIEDLFGSLLRTVRNFRFPFQFGSVTFHVANGEYVRTEYHISVK